MDARAPLPEVRKKDVKEAFSSIFLKSALFLGLIVALGFGVQRFFSWAAFEGASPEELFTKSLDGRTDVKRMAAAEWVRLLQDADVNARVRELETLRPTSAQVAKLGSLLSRWAASCQAEEVPWLGSLITVLGYSPPQAGAEPLLRSLLSAIGPTSPCESLDVMGLASLARLGANSAEDLGLFQNAALDSDSSRRKIAAFGLGAFLKTSQTAPEGSPLPPDARETSKQRLEALLQDNVEDVRWNAAFALAGAGQAEAVPVLRDLLVRAERTGQAEPGSEPLTATLFAVYRESFRAVARLHDEALRGELQKLSESHANVKLRQAAKEAFSEGGTPRQ